MEELEEEMEGRAQNAECRTQAAGRGANVLSAPPIFDSCISLHCLHLHHVGEESVLDEQLQQSQVVGGHDIRNHSVVV